MELLPLVDRHAQFDETGHPCLLAHSPIHRNPFGMRASGHRLKPDPSTLSQFPEQASCIRLRVLTLPMWTHFPLAFAFRHSALACSLNFHSVEPPTNKASIRFQGTGNASCPSWATKATGNPLAAISRCQAWKSSSVALAFVTTSGATTNKQPFFPPMRSSIRRNFCSLKPANAPLSAAQGRLVSISDWILLPLDGVSRWPRKGDSLYRRTVLVAPLTRRSKHPLTAIRAFCGLARTASSWGGQGSSGQRGSYSPPASVHPSVEGRNGRNQGPHNVPALLLIVDR